MNTNLRPVEYWIQKDNIKIGFFHTWGKRSDEYATEFFGVVETLEGECLELDPQQITFRDRAK